MGGDTRTALYRLFDFAGRLLYVGIAADPEARWSVHARTQEWWFMVARKEVIWFSNRAAARAAEVAAIEAEDPAWNLWHSPQLQKVGSSWVREMPVIPAALLAERESAQQLAEDVRREAVVTLHAATSAFQATRMAAERQQLHDAIVKALRARVRPRDVDKVVPYDRNHVRRIAKAAGLPPLKDPTVQPRDKES